jgi:hypothetical protein
MKLEVPTDRDTIHFRHTLLVERILLTMVPREFFKLSSPM